MTNHLAGQNSPYLLQHAENPVDWYPWGEEALSKARRENKPIFLSIGYAACHWCHVMAHESFEDPTTAEILNRDFVSIKVDREERPDLDGIYMQATTAMTGSGGWPMSVFLTPELRPFYAGTYFPPVQRYNMPAFTDVLQSVAQAWREDREGVERSAGGIAAQLAQPAASAKGEIPSEQLLSEVEASLVSGADRVHGGWGQAPKFPQPMLLEFLLRRVAAGRSSQPEALDVTLQTLDSMARGGMYEVVGGGFARYSTDDTWHVPHFEKMLYDQAQLALCYLHAWLVTHRPQFQRVAMDTLDFVTREMHHPSGGYFSSLDADSEGVEGKFYVWSEDELRQALADPALFDLFAAAYGVSARGNWEGKIVLQRALDEGTLASRFKIEAAEVAQRLNTAHARLLQVRQQRKRPATDDKVIAAWNGLMLQAFAQASRFLGESEKATEYRELATRTGRFLLHELRPKGRLRRIWRAGRAGEQVFLEDYAAVILGLLDLYEAVFDHEWFIAAHELADQMIELFADPDGGFFDTPSDGEQVPRRPKDLQDGATPSGNALACEALLRLAAFTADGKYRDIAERTLAIGLVNARRYPTSFARWLSLADMGLAGEQQLAVVHPPESDAEPFLRIVNARYRPNLSIAVSPYPPSEKAPPLLLDRPLIDGLSTAYLCQSFVCHQPVTAPHELLAQLEAK